MVLRFTSENIDNPQLRHGFSFENMAKPTAKPMAPAPQGPRPGAHIPEPGRAPVPALAHGMLNGTTSLNNTDTYA